VCFDHAVDSAASISEMAGNILPDPIVVVSDGPDLAKARRVGLSNATGAWVTFPLPLGVLSDRYLIAITAAISAPQADDLDAFVIPQGRAGVHSTSAASLIVEEVELDDWMSRLSSDLSRVVTRNVAA